MTTIYKFKAGYTKLGIATAPSSAPTITVVDSANNILVAALTATTALTNQVGAYLYSYSGADGLDLIGLFHTSDATMDQQDLFSVPDMFSLMATAAALATAQGNITTILADYARRTGDYATVSALSTLQGNVTTILADYARRTGDYATVAALTALLTAIDEKISTPGLGSGSTAYTPNRATDANGSPLGGVDTWVNASSTDPGASVSARAYTNELGLISYPFMLDPGTYYVWRQKDGYSFPNPEAIEVE
jgi:hypothetical protein